LSDIQAFDLILIGNLSKGYRPGDVAGLFPFQFGIKVIQNTVAKKKRLTESRVDGAAREIC
jgi:hypothetical protein